MRTLATPWVWLFIASAAALSLFRPRFLASSESAVYDALVRSARQPAPAPRIVIVDIDERSLATIGQWPWRRDVLGRLVSELRRRGASAVALDILFAEPERTADGGASTDAALAKTLRGGRVVLGAAMTFDRAAANQISCVQQAANIVVVKRGADEDVNPFFQATGEICSLPRLTEAADASGFMNAAPDSDGIVRRVPLLLQRDGRTYPSLALAAFMIATRPGSTVLRVANANSVSLTLGDRSVPLDGKSHMLLRYRGPKHTFPYVSAADVLSGRVEAGTFSDKIVFVGTTALGTREVVATPLDTLFAAIEVQATVADNLIQRDFFHRPEDAVTIETLAVAAFGATAVLLVSWLGLARGALGIAALLTMGWAGAAAWLSVAGIFVSPLAPTISAAGAFAVMATARLKVERRRADTAVAGKAASRRMMIQSLLSLTETRDAETGQHSRRTQRNMRILAGQLARRPEYRGYLTPERIELLAILAPLHDIGKVGVADRVLGKPGALTSAETVEMRRHPVLGRDVIARAEREIGVDEDGVLATAKEIVYTHHERWDGTGYPQGLRGAEIPIAGRLMAIVDVYDAAVSRRRYQAAMSHDEAIALIVGGRGTHFDPAVVDAFLEVSTTLFSVAS